MLVAGIIVIIIIVLIHKYRTRVVYSKVPLGTVDWSLMQEFDDPQAAARLLSETNTKMIEFMRVLKAKYFIDATDDVDWQEHTNIPTMQSHGFPNNTRELVDTLLNNYNPEQFYETFPRGNTSETTYTINKGDSMYICLRDRADPTKLVDANTLFFVILHECAHIANYVSWGHGKDFWEIFAFLLHEAEEAGVYTRVNYAKTPMSYCGMTIDYNPLNDSNLRKLWL